MKKIFLTIIMGLIATLSFSQTVPEIKGFEYVYDICGNRHIRRYIVMDENPTSVMQKNDNNLEEQSNLNPEKYDDFVNGKKITIYPNPTEGILKIDINNYIYTKSKISLIDINGKILYTTESIENSTTLDLSDKNNGIYILQIDLDNKRSEWKIFKK